MPNRGPITHADPQVATNRYVLGRGPGTESECSCAGLKQRRRSWTTHGIERAKALERALRNELAYQAGTWKLPARLSARRSHGARHCWRICGAGAAGHGGASPAAPPPHRTSTGSPFWPPTAELKGACGRCAPVRTSAAGTLHRPPHQSAPLAKRRPHQCSTAPHRGCAPVYETSRDRLKEHLSASRWSLRTSKSWPKRWRRPRA